MAEMIRIEIDATQLDSVIAKINGIKGPARQIGGRKSLGTALPSINRELRVLLGQVPGMRQAMQGYFMLTRGERAYRKFTSTPAPTFAGTATLVLSIAASIIIIAQRIQQMIKQIEREEEQFMRFVMKRRQFSEEEFKRQKIIMKYQLKGQPT